MQMLSQGDLVNHASDRNLGIILMMMIQTMKTPRRKMEQGTNTQAVRACTRSQMPQSSTSSGYILDGWEPQKVRQVQLEDQNMSIIMTSLEDGTGRPKWDKVSGGSSELKTIWRQWDRLEINNRMFYRKFYREDENKRDYCFQLIVPKTLRQAVFRHFHDIPLAGHLGPDKMIHRIQQSFYWPAMKQSITEYCKNCDQCSARKPSRLQNRAPLGQYLVGEPIERVAVDILGPLPVTERGNRYILVLCDCFTKWTEAYAIPDQESLTIAKIIVDEFICRFGTPLQIHSDQGRSFEAKLFQDLCNLLQIDKTRTTSQRPQANGNVERFNRTLTCMLTSYCENDQKHWDEFLPQVLMAYRSSVHASTGKTPNMMMLGRNITLPMEAVIPKPVESDEIDAPEIDEYIVSLQNRLAASHELARKHLKQNSDYQKRHYDLKAFKRDFSVGQPVWLYDASKRMGVCHKLTSRWKGPYVVTRKLDDITYLVKRSKKQAGKVYHVDRLLPYRGRNPPTWYSKEKDT